VSLSLSLSLRLRLDVDSLLNGIEFLFQLINLAAARPLSVIRLRF
jgi:hypothetical protein